MNEVKKIHLGREVFVISAAAYSELNDYIEAIERSSDHQDIVDEVEARISELLLEQGASDTKAVTIKDVALIKKQLGEPSDFKEDASSTQNERNKTDRRLYRDTSNAYLFGVSSGLAQYFNVDVVLVRIVFIALAFASGFGIFLYLILGLVVPEAKSKADFLALKGKSVNVKNLMNQKSADQLTKTARGASFAIAQMIRKLFRLVLKITGVSLAVLSIILAVLVVALGTALIFHGVNYGLTTVFPVTTTDKLSVLTIGMAILSALLFVLIAGLALSGKKIHLKSWTVASMIGILLVFSGVGAGLGSVAFQNTIKAYERSMVTKTVPLQGSVADLYVDDADFSVRYEQAAAAEVQMKMRGSNPQDYITLKQEGAKLTINGDALDKQSNCVVLCAIEKPEVIVRAPQIESVHVYGRAGFYIGDALKQSKLSIFADKQTQNVSIKDKISAKKLSADVRKSGGYQIALYALGEGEPAEVHIHTNNLGLRASEVGITSDEECKQYAGENQLVLAILGSTEKFTINGQEHQLSEFEAKQAARRGSGASFYNCIVNDLSSTPPKPTLDQ